MSSANSQAVSERDLNVMVDSITRYFGQLTNEHARVSAAFLNETGETLPAYDFTGTIEISGAYQGSVYFTAPRLMIRYLLLSVGETMQSDEVFLDAAGEIANTIAGNARAHFGDGLTISTPATAKGSVAPSTSATRARPLVVKVEWKTLAAALVVDLTRT
jgi:chemotaxis protein CheX